MSRRVPDKIALPTTRNNAPQQQPQNNRVPDQITLPEWRPQPAPQAPPAPQPSQQQQQQQQPEPMQLDPGLQGNQTLDQVTLPAIGNNYQPQQLQQDYQLPGYNYPPEWLLERRRTEIEQQQQQRQQQWREDLELMEQLVQAEPTIDPRLFNSSDIQPSQYYPQGSSQQAIAQDFQFQPTAPQPQQDPQPQYQYGEPQYSVTDGYANAEDATAAVRAQRPPAPVDGAPAAGSLVPVYYKTCNHCRTIQRKCTGKSPCFHCISIGKGDQCTYEFRFMKAANPSAVPPATPPAGGRGRKRKAPPAEDPDETDDEIVVGGAPAKPKKRVRFRASLEDVIYPPNRRRLGNLRPSSSAKMCDHCRAGGDRGKPCDANHEEQIECSQCTRHRNLTDPNHLCTVRGYDYWQKRFANSRPTYPVHDGEASCCTPCRIKRAAGHPTYCDVDPTVKIGCTPCREEGGRCLAFNEERAVGKLETELEPWERMWHRPTPGDDTIKNGRKPWWRHMCEACISHSDEKNFAGCSWTEDFRLGDYRCSSCRKNKTPCIDPYTEEEFKDDYAWPGVGDNLSVQGRGVQRQGRYKCTNCRINAFNCRGVQNYPGYACTKCVAWGLRCQIPSEAGSLRVADRKWIGWARRNGDLGMNFVACLSCRVNKRNCDRKRPCDSCANSKTACDPFTARGGTINRARTLGADSATYYMALGYGPNGVDSNRLSMPDEDMVGPNRPKWCNMNPPEPKEERSDDQEADSGSAPARDFGTSGPTPGPTSAPAPAPAQDFNVGAGYNAFFNSFSPRTPTSSATPQSSPPSLTRAPTPASNSSGAQPFGSLSPPGFLGDNGTASDAQDGNIFATWLNTYNVPGSSGAIGGDTLLPFENRKEAEEELSRILGEDSQMTGMDLDDLPADYFKLDDFFKFSPSPPQAPAPADAAPRAPEDDIDGIDASDQNAVVRAISEAMMSYLRDSRFVPVALRYLAVPEIFDVPESAQVPPPERVLLELTSQPGSASPPSRKPFAPEIIPNSGIAYETRMRSLLRKWQRPRFNVFRDVPDNPVDRSAWLPGSERQKTCEEWKTVPEIDGTKCGQPAPAVCDNLEHMIRPGGHPVCDACDVGNKRNLFQGMQPLTHGEFLRMRFYACYDCAAKEARDVVQQVQQRQQQEQQQELQISRGATKHYGFPAAQPAQPITGCSCASKLIGRRLCAHHRYRLASQLMIHVMFVAEWAVANFGAEGCLFCKGDKAKAMTAGTGLVYLCLNCEGVVSEDGPAPELRPGVEGLLGASANPPSLTRPDWSG
ncbi:hypothetical protein CMUS01_07827 [Colletotrichum musicola]|uniref:Zn(2)-C6 fungal-type domain-containing protein n=1 Tax=Colletotrichum musicola TaxID=2175873 RepID=A0A8H6KGD9_9PEZI|nr:hypothetical protein CMUS01_07827 [Colletotrichum musicola]